MKKTSVTVGIRTDTEVEIRSGLSVGDTVLQNLPDGLQVGDAVTPLLDNADETTEASSVS